MKRKPHAHYGANFQLHKIAGVTFYTPSGVGYEQVVAERLERWRAALGIEGREGPWLSQAEVERMKKER